MVVASLVGRDGATVSAFLSSLRPEYFPVPVGIESVPTEGTEGAKVGLTTSEGEGGTMDSFKFVLTLLFTASSGCNCAASVSNPRASIPMSRVDPAPCKCSATIFGSKPAVILEIFLSISSPPNSSTQRVGSAVCSFELFALCSFELFVAVEVIQGTGHLPRNNVTPSWRVSRSHSSSDLNFVSNEN
jgi:hypothetical protein